MKILPVCIAALQRGIAVQRGLLYFKLWRGSDPCGCLIERNNTSKFRSSQALIGASFRQYSPFKAKIKAQKYAYFCEYHRITRSAPNPGRPDFRELRYVQLRSERIAIGPSAE